MTRYLDFLLPAQELSPKLAEVHWGSQEAQEALLQQQLDHFVLVFRWQDGSMERRQVLPEQR